LAFQRPGSAAAVLGLAARERRSPALALTLAGFLSNLAALVLTGIFELPINARVLTWSPENPPEGWESSMNRWQAVHTARTVISVIGLASLLAAALTSATGSDSDNATGLTIKQHVPPARVGRTDDPFISCPRALSGLNR
jgi:hypothetical protein